MTAAMHGPATGLVLAKTVKASQVYPGWTAFGIVVGLGVAVFFLWRSMLKQLRKVSFEEAPDESADAEPPRTPAPVTPPDASAGGDEPHGGTGRPDRGGR